MKKCSHINRFIIAAFLSVLAACLVFTGACDDDNIDGTKQWCEYKVGEQYSQDNGEFIISHVEASCGISVDGNQFEGYYLSVYGEMDMASFTLSSDDFCMFEDWESSTPLLDREICYVNTVISAILSDAELHANQLYGEAAYGNYCFVFDMSETTYNKLYARKDIPIDPENYGYDLEMDIDCLNYTYNSQLCIAEFKISASEIVFG